MQSQAARMGKWVGGMQVAMMSKGYSLQVSMAEEKRG